MTQPSPIELTYGRQAPIYRRYRKAIIFALLLIGVVAGIWLAKTRLERAYYMWNYRREAARWYAASLTWVEPQTKLKYTENPIDAPVGRKFERGYGKSGSNTVTGFQSFGGAFVERLPLFYGDGRPALTGSPDEIMLLMHQRTTTDGRITSLIAVSNPRFDGNVLGIEVDQIDMPAPGRPRILKGGYRKLDMTGISGPGEIRIFAGQRDPADPSRFSILFEARGRTGFIDGVFEPGTFSSKDPKLAQFEADFNANVKLTVRMSPATQPATQAATQPQ